jgi:Xaa-Pro aminopeptidase
MFYGGVMNGQVSIQEMERRWQAVRHAMQERKIDVLFAYSASDMVGGHVRYLLDLPSGGSYPTSLVFPRDDDMTLVVHGSYRGDKSSPPVKEGPVRGVKRMLTAPAFLSVSLTKTYEAEQCDIALAPFRGARVGVLAPANIPYPLMEYLRGHALSQTELIDASDLVDQIKAIKSAEELQLMRIHAARQDEAMRMALNAVEPGVEERRIVEVANQHMRFHGSAQGILMSGAGPIGTPSGIRMPFMQGGRVERGDQYHMLLEVNSREGYYTEIGRTCVLGKPTKQML